LRTVIQDEIYPCEEQKYLIGIGDRRRGRNPNEVILLDITVLSFPIAAHLLSDPLAFESNAGFKTSDRCTLLPQEGNDLSAIPPSFLAIPLQICEVFAGLYSPLLWRTFFNVRNERDEGLDRLHASSKDMTNQPPAWGLASALPSVRGRGHH